VEILRLPFTEDSSALADEQRTSFVYLPAVDEDVAENLAGEPALEADVTAAPAPTLAADPPPIVGVDPLPPPAAAAEPADRPAGPPLEPLPAAEGLVGRAWWDGVVPRPLRADAAPWEMDLDGLLMIALEHSEHVLAVSLEPQIRETEIARQVAQFDTAAFLDSKWNDLNDPVGNTLTTGGPTRYLDDHWFNRGGFKRLNWYGGQAELAQEMGLRNTNSVFFVPASQANMRLVMSYTQPLMRGRGRLYNESVIVLAQADTEVARHDLERQLQEHFFQVSEAYWRLWLERARFLQQKDAATTTARLLRELEARREIDVLESHILRARGAVAVRQAAVQRAELAVRNQEARLWAMTGAPELHLSRAAELVPQSLPSFELPPLDRDASVQEALQQRPEITATLEKIRAAQTKLEVATHELMPALNLAMQAYAHGLNGEFDVGRAFINQFGLGAPGYTAGIYYEAPIGNAAAQARLRRRQLEARQLALQFEATLKSVSADVDNAIRDIEAARATAHGQHQAMLASRAELDYLLTRWRMMPGEDRATSLMLDEALDALDRLVAAEGSLAQAQVDYALALIQFKRATGQLFQVQRVGPLPHAEVLISRRPPAAIEGAREAR
jgi:outer membrane protein TolC